MFFQKDLQTMEKNSLSTTDINDSVKGHMLCYAAEIARKEKRVVSLEEFDE